MSIRTNIQELVVIGGGFSFGETFELINDINGVKQKYKIVAILDDSPDLFGKCVNGLENDGESKKVLDSGDFFKKLI